MRILIAPDKFKGTLRSIEVAEAVERGIKKVLPDAQTVVLPLADGGEGTVDALVRAMDGSIIYCQVAGPLNEPVKAYFGLLPSPLAPKRINAVIEMSAASGLHLIPPEKRNPLIATTYGTGELIMLALKYDVAEIIIGIGGSGTVDGGMGMAQALGVKFFDEKGCELGLGGKELKKICRIDVSGLDGRLKKANVLVASDVKNPLHGPSGAAYFYGPQKGATPEMVKELDRGLINYATIIKHELGKDVNNIAGAGAAGGLGAGLIAFLDAQLESGIELVMKVTGFRNKLNGADLVITGEGKIDAQTVFGKVPVGVAEVAKEEKVPVYAICGQRGEGAADVYDHGIKKIFAISDIAKSLADACNNATLYVEMISEKLAKEI